MEDPYECMFQAMWITRFEGTKKQNQKFFVLNNKINHYLESAS